MRRLADVKMEREIQESEKKERKSYRENADEVPVRLWTTHDMLNYFNEVRKKHKIRINKFLDKRTVYTQLAVIKRLKIKGPVFVEFIHWAERSNEIFPIDIYHLVNQIKRFRKVRKDLFDEKKPDRLSVE